MADERDKCGQIRNAHETLILHYHIAGHRGERERETFLTPAKYVVK